MAYLPRVAFAATCAHCGVDFAAQHLGRKYCSTPCNALATQARKKARLAAAEAALAEATAELARARAELAALRPAPAPAPVPAPAPAVTRPPAARVPARRFQAPVTAQVLLKRAQRLLGRKIGPGGATRLLGQTHLPGQNPATVLQLYVLPQGLWWRNGWKGQGGDRVHTDRVWISADEQAWVEREADPRYPARDAATALLVRVNDVSTTDY